MATARLWTSAPDGSGVPGALYLNFRRTNLTDHILVAPPGTLTSNAFQHIAFTYNRPLGSLSLYHNGAMVGQQTVGSFRSAVTNDVYLGWRPGTTNVFAGLLDEFALYNRKLTSSEIASIHAAGAVGPNHLLITSRDPSGVSLILRGTANRRYVLERSTDLRTWTSITSALAPLDGVARMKDPRPPAGQAFYRAEGE